MISVITWDASFRENLHTIKAFGEQASDKVEFLWVDFYHCNEKVKDLLSNYRNCRAINLAFERTEPWHLGKCINAGVSRSVGDILIIPDGDIVISPGFIEKVIADIAHDKSLVAYYRRFDETSKIIENRENFDIQDLEKHCVLTNPANYAGCLALHREMFEKINGYEEHWAFSGPGINGMETYTRLRNCGAYIKWSDARIYHPWHASTGSSSTSQQEKLEMRQLSAKYHWLLPYAGVIQSWIVYQRSLNLAVQSSETECDRLIDALPNELKSHAKQIV